MIYEFDFEKTWKNVRVMHKEGYFTSASDFHTHPFYEINLILDGNFNILLKSGGERGNGCRLVLSPPGTPHYVTCSPDTLFKRIFLLFSENFIKDYVPEWRFLLSAFGENGRVLKLSPMQKEMCEKIIIEIELETDIFRQRILTLYLLSKIAEFEDITFYKCPDYIIEALNFVSEHYSEKIVAGNLAEKLGISRTTLFSSFKKYTGNTFNFYLLDLRFKKAISLLSEGYSVQEAAEKCGFSEVSAFSRAFKKRFSVSPLKYFKKDI